MLRNLLWNLYSSVERGRHKELATRNKITKRIQVVAHRGEKDTRMRVRFEPWARSREQKQSAAGREQRNAMLWEHLVTSHIRDCRIMEREVYSGRQAVANSEWSRVVPLALARSLEQFCVLCYAWKRWRSEKNMSKVIHLSKFGTGVYCYAVPELKVTSVVGVNGESLLANEFLVVKVGQTCQQTGGFDVRLQQEMREISNWRHASSKNLHERLIFLLPETDARSSEKKMLACLGARIGLAPVHRQKTQPALDAALSLEPSRTLDDLLLRRKKRLSVGHAWRIWLSTRRQHSVIGPSELLVVSKQLAMQVEGEFRNKPGVLRAADVVYMARHNVALLREITMDFGDAEASLGPLTFLVG